MTEQDLSEHTSMEPIAIIGMACRVPGAANLGEFWANLRDGVESIRTITDAELLAAGASQQRLANPQLVRAAPVLDGIEDFDAGQFGLSRREAEILGPAHRVFLECAVAALDHAGYDPARYPGEIGVYGGVGSGEYQWHNLLTDRAFVAAVGTMAIALGNNRDYAPTYLSYKLNLRGPSVAVSTACSTGLVSVHLASEAVRNGECDMALAGAASIEMGQLRGYLYQEGSILSPDGHCRSFDADAHGTLWGSGGGMVLLKRLSDAIADGDTVHALLLGSAINNDGSDKVGFSAPSVSGQSEVIAQALGVAGVKPADIGYVEAHGTGTQVGDPIEVRALADAFGADSLPPGSCRLGTVKPNIGHLAAAAGVVGLIKTVLSLENEQLPPTLHFKRPNPAIHFDETPFRVVAAAEPWPGGALPRRAGVSSFGMGGTNAHAIVEEAPPAPQLPESGKPQVVVLSAKTPSALDTMTADLVEHLRTGLHRFSAAGQLSLNPAESLDDVAYTLQVGRRAFGYRRAVVASELADAADVLSGAAPRRLLTGRATDTAGPVFLFPGQGTQRVGMAAELYRQYPVVREHIDAGLRILDDLLEVDLRAILFADPGDAAAAAELRETRTTQPALFLVEYALAQLWMSLGVRPTAMLGHSLGEYVAACLAGVFTFTDALRLVAVRAKLMQEQPAGAMLAIQLDPEMLELAAAGLDLAAVNAPMTCVASGSVEAVDAYERTLAEEGVPVKRLRTSHAFHSAMMNPVADAFAAELRRTELRAPQLPIVSNLTGGWLTAEQATDPEYWVEHLLSAVQFGPGIETLLNAGSRIMLEVGPAAALTGLARMQPRADVPEPVTTMPTPGEGEHEAFLTAAGRLWALGVPVDWAVTHEVARRRVPLPGHPFERQRHWIEAQTEQATTQAAGWAATTNVEGRLPMPQWYWLPVWRQTARPVPAGVSGADGPWLVLRDPAGYADPLVARLRDRGDLVVTVTPDAAYAAGPDGFTVRPGSADDFERLLDELGAADATPARIVHAWAAGPGGAGPLDAAATRATVPLAFTSLLAMAQALAARDLIEKMDLTVLTGGAHGVTGDDLRSPARAVVTGPLKVLPLEFPGMTCRQLDIDGAVLDPDLVLDELAADGPEVVAYRRDRRWLPEYDATALEAPTAARAGLREGGAYVITGGFGGVGLSIAEDLAQRVHAKLVLVGRVALGERADWPRLAREPGKIGRQARTLLRIEQLGGEVLAVAADVTDPAGARRVRDLTIERFGAVHGVIHAAGVAGGTMIEAQTDAVAAAVLEPKLFATLALVDAFGGDKLDFLALCSSVTAIAGSLGQVDYCAGNAYMDAFAHSNSAPWPVVSINWGGWLEVGMAAETAAPAAFREVQAGARQEPFDHPLLEAVRVREGSNRQVFSARLAADTHWVLDEHRIAGTPTVPGTGYLEMVRAAFAATQPGRAVELQDVVFLTPLGVPDGTSCEVRVVIEDVVDGGEFRVESQAGDDQRVHVRGHVHWAASGTPEAVDLEAIRSRCDRDLRTTSMQESASGLLSFGPRWSSLAEVRVGDGEELARLGAGEIVAGELAGYGLHPALLDEATAFGAFDGAQGRYLPLGYGRLVVHRGLPATVFSHLRHRDTATAELLTCDITLLDADGEVLAEISDFMLRRIDAAEISAAVGERPASTEKDSTAADNDSQTDKVGIRPAEGGEALARLLGARLGPQAAVTALHLPTLIAKVQRLTRAKLTEELDGQLLTEGAGNPVLSDGYIAPRTPLEQQLAQLWEEATGAVGIGVEHNFFDVGGNSLVASQLINRIRGEFGIKLPMRVLFESPTIAGMAEMIEKGRRATA